MLVVITATYFDNLCGGGYLLTVVAEVRTFGGICVREKSGFCDTRYSYFKVQVGMTFVTLQVAYSGAASVWEYMLRLRISDGPRTKKSHAKRKVVAC